MSSLKFLSLFLFGLLWHAVSSSNLEGKHGSLHPKDETNCTKNTHKLEIFFSKKCVSSDEDAEQYIEKLISDFPSCFSNETNFTQNIFHSPKKNRYWAYVAILYPGCEDDVDIDYDDYCIKDIEYEPILEKRDVCTTDSCSMPSGYNGGSAPDKDCLWHLDFLDGSQNDEYNHLDNDVSSSDIYIIDWGMRTSHNEFSPNRATQIGASDNNDYHGTHCAGIAGGNTVGVAKSSPIYSVAIDNGAGQGFDVSCEVVIANMESRNSQFGTTRRSVVSMSWGWSFSSSDFSKYNDYFDEMAELGGIMFAATTNSPTEHTAPCDNHGKDGPGGCTNVITVSNYNYNNQIDYAGYGECVDVAGPGTSVTSAWYTCDSCYNELTGTSMATPAVAGFAANILNYDDSITVEQMRSILTDGAITTSITGPYVPQNLPALGGSCSSVKSVVDSYSTGGGGDSDSDSDDSGNVCDNCCSNGCEIPASWFNDGTWCDCPNCEDEDSCTCTSSSNCPDPDLTDSSCYYDYYTGSCSSSKNEDGSSSSGKSDGSSSGRNRNNNDTTVEILIYVLSAVVLVVLIAIVAVCMIKRRNLNKQMVDYNAQRDSQVGYKPPTAQQTNA